MALLEVGGNKVTIPVGDVVLGSEAGCTIQLSGAGVLGRHAVLQGRPDGQVVIRKAAPEADVLINGVRLGAEPTPLLHGDKVEVGGHELTFVDERRSGSTQYIQAMQMPQAAAEAKAAAAAGRPTANTGGRVVSLTDGREYRVAGNSLVFGREATCDVVVSGKDVSRRHAEIVPTPKGYLLVDSSTNGTFVNEERVQGQRILARADVVRIGEENFRFYADLAPAAAPHAAPPPASPPPPLPPPPPPPPPPTPAPPVTPSPPPGSAASKPPAAPPTSLPPAGAGERLKDTSFGLPPARPAAGGPLATFLVKSGALKGQRIRVRTPVLNIGRADYNDFVVPDESVSTAHAKLQRREGVWILTDLDSTNGTFVDGERVKGETPIAPGALVRLGDVQLVFDPTDDALGVAKGGGTKLIEVVKPPAAPSVAPKPAPPARRPPARAQPKRAPAPPAAEKQGKGCGPRAAVLVLGASALVYWLLV